jgi:hypothetical protein
VLDIEGDKNEFTFLLGEKFNLFESKDISLILPPLSPEQAREGTLGIISFALQKG